MLTIEHYKSLSKEEAESFIGSFREEYKELKRKLDQDTRAEIGVSPGTVKRIEELEEFFKKVSISEGSYLGEHELSIFKAIDLFSLNRGILFDLNGYKQEKYKGIILKTGILLGITPEEVKKVVKENRRYIEPIKEDFPNIKIYEDYENKEKNIQQEEIDSVALEFQLLEFKDLKGFKPLEFSIRGDKIETSSGDMEEVYRYLENTLLMERDYLKKLFLMRIGEGTLKI